LKVAPIWLNLANSFPWARNESWNKGVMTGKVIFILGGPGVGKGTQCTALASATDSTYIHLSAGDLLRAERNRPDSPYGAIINENIRQGTIVPSQITIDLLKAAMKDSSVKCEYFLIDGFPRNIAQGIAFEDQVEPCKALLFFECPDDVLVGRLLKRSQTSGRDDDNIEAIRKRLVTYQNETLPVIDHYRNLGKVHEIDCSHDINAVTEKVKAIIEQIKDL